MAQGGGCAVLGLGDRLKGERERAGLNQTELGRRIDVDQSTISKVERGLMGLTLEAAVAAAALLGVRPCWLLFGEGDREPTPGDAYLAGMAAAYREIARVAASLAGDLG